MKNLNMLEEIRTKKELVDYFKSLGKNITEEEIEALKQSYVKAQENGNALTLQQLNDVAGGMEREDVTFQTRNGNTITLRTGTIRAITRLLINPMINNPFAEEQTTRGTNTDGQTVPQPGQPVITDQGTIFLIGRLLSEPNQSRGILNPNTRQDSHLPPPAPAA